MSRLLVTVLIVATAVVAIIFGLDQRDENEQIERNTTALLALCTFRADLVRRADDTDRFMREIETGVRIPIPGITKGDLARSLQGQRATIESLSILDCKEAP